MDTRAIMSSTNSRINLNILECKYRYVNDFEK